MGPDSCQGVCKVIWHPPCLDLMLPLMADLLKAWSEWHASGASGVLAGDEALLDRPDLICDIGSWDEFVASEEWVSKSKRLHLGLTPTPFVGFAAPCPASSHCSGELCEEVAGQGVLELPGDSHGALGPVGDVLGRA